MAQGEREEVEGRSDVTDLEDSHRMVLQMQLGAR